MASRGNGDRPDIPNQQHRPQRQRGGQPGQQYQHQPPAPRQTTTPATTGDDSLDTRDILCVIAALVPGLGQMLLGQTAKGLVLLVLSIVTACVGGLISVASVIDAFLVVKAQKKRPVDDWEFFPDFKEGFGLE